MAILNNTSIVLGFEQAKKDAVVDQPGIAAAAGEMRIWAAAGVDETKTQSNIGDFHKLFRFALSDLSQVGTSADPTIYHMISGGSDADIERDGTPTAAQLRLEIGATLIDLEQSHFIDRTFKRLIERWLEEAK